MKRGIKLRAQTTVLPERKVRLRLSGQLGAELEEYRDLYAQVHAHEIELPALIEGIPKQFFASDRAFQRTRRGSAEAPQRAASSSSAENVS